MPKANRTDESLDSLAPLGTETKGAKGKGKGNRKEPRTLHSTWHISYNPAEFESISTSTVSTPVLDRVKQFLRDIAHSWVIAQEGGEGTMKKIHWHIAFTTKRDKGYRADTPSTTWYKRFDAGEHEVFITPHHEWVGAVGYATKDGRIQEQVKISDEFIKHAREFYKDKDIFKKISEFGKGGAVIGDARLPRYRGAVMALKGCSEEDADRELAKLGFTHKSFGASQFAKECKKQQV